jgi:hypothetical protein
MGAASNLEGGTPPPAGTPPPTNGGTPPPAGTPPAPTGTPPAWATGLSAEQTNLLKNKSWYGDEMPLAKVLDGYSNLEKMVKAGPVDKIVRIPEEGDEEGASALWNKLGRPEKVDGYKIPDKLAEAYKSDFVMQALPAFAHAQGFSQKQFESLLAFGQVQGAAVREAEAARYKAEGAKASGELRAEWGNAFDRNIAAVDALQEKVGMPDDVFHYWAKTHGVKEVLRSLSERGGGLVEAGFRSGGPAQPGNYAQLSPAEAKAELRRLGSDPDFQAKLRRNDGVAMGLKRQLDAAMVGLKPEEFTAGLPLDNRRH